MAQKSWFDKNLRKINRLLLVAIVLLNAYVVITPFLPQVTYRADKVFNKPQQLDTPEDRLSISRDFDHLVIPELGIDEKIWIGSNKNLVHKGVWQIPHSSTPDKGSNTVLVGHRFSYKNPAVFYHLDKLKPDDIVVMAWGGKLYTYRVDESKLVKPEDVYVEDPSEEPMLTLYTCHPLWSVRERLVVTAKLEHEE